MAAGTMYPLSSSDLKAFIPGANPNDRYYLTDIGREGEFYLEGSYGSPQPADDAITILSNNISGTYHLYKRIIDDGTISVKWFGATGTGVDDILPIQAAIDAAINSDGATPNVYFPAGDYGISFPIVCRAALPEHSCYVNLLGDSSFVNELQTRITASFSDKFAIGIQIGFSCAIKNLEIIGTYNRSGMSDYPFYNSTLQEYLGIDWEESRYCPYAGIVLDPFTNSNTAVPTIENEYAGYPEMRDYYQGEGSTGGSTGCLIENVRVRQFVVGVCFAPNAYEGENGEPPGGTRQCELMRIFRLQVNFCAIGISCSQDQEKTNVFEHLMFWNDVHTCFAQGIYGFGLPGQHLLRDIDIAGRVNQVIYYPSPDYFNTHIENIYAESLGRFGTFHSIVGSSVTGGDLTFVSLEQIISEVTLPKAIPDAYLRVSGIKFTNVHFHFVNDREYPLTVSGINNLFYHCTFPAVPFIGTEEDFSIGVNTRFVDCTIMQNNNQPFGWTHTIQYTSNGPIYSYGNGSITDYVSVRYGQKKTLTFENDLPTFLTGGGVQATALSITNNILEFDPLDPWNYNVNELVLYNNTDSSAGAVPFGIVTANDNTTVTIGMITGALTTISSAYFFVVHPIKFVCSFMGNVTANTDTITCVVSEWGAPALLEGEYIRVFNINSNYSAWVKVASVGVDTVTIHGIIKDPGEDLPFNIQGKCKIVLSGVAGELDVLHAYLTGTEVVDQRGNRKIILKSGKTPASGLYRHYTFQSLNVDGVNHLGLSARVGERDTSSDKTMLLYYDTGNNVGVIQGVQLNVGVKPVAMQIGGGNVIIGTTADSGQRLQVAGTASFTGIVTNAALSGTGIRNVAASPTGELSIAGVSDNVDAFNLASDNSRTIDTNELTEYILLKAGTNVTGIIVGTTNGGSDIATVNLIANQTFVLSYKRFADSPFDIYFGNITVTVNFRIIKKVII